MNTLEKSLKMFVRDVLELPEAQIKSGRDNAVQSNFETDYIVVDDLAPSERIAGSLDFDGVTEVQTISNVYMTTFTIDFYGANAYDYCNRFVLLARSQKAYALKKVLGIGIYQVSSIQDLKKLTGQQYGNRYQVTIKVEDCRAVDVDTLRIDEAKIETTTS
jgi:hypothetical protein